MKNHVLTLVISLFCLGLFSTSLFMLGVVNPWLPILSVFAGLASLPLTMWLSDRLLQAFGFAPRRIVRVNENEFNNAQSVHTESVEVAVANAARDLWQYYKFTDDYALIAFEQLCKYVNNLPNDPNNPSHFKIQAAKRAILQFKKSQFFNKESRVSLKAAMALAWKGLTDEEQQNLKRIERQLTTEEAELTIQQQEVLLSKEEADILQESIVDWLYRVQRNYNISKSGEDDKKADSPSCEGGVFNLSLYALQGRHTQVNIPVVDKAYIAEQFQIQARRCFDRLSEAEKVSYAEKYKDKLPKDLVLLLTPEIRAALHKQFDEFQSSSLDVNKIIEDNLFALKYAKIDKLAEMAKEHEQAARIRV